MKAKTGVRTVSLVSLVVAGIILGFVVGLRLLQFISERPFVAAPLQQGASTVTPTSTPGSRRAILFEPLSLPLTTTIEVARVIAEVQVTAVYTPMLNTVGGATPATPLSSDVMQDDDEGWDIRTMVEFEVLTLYKGDESYTHFVSQILGGQVVQPDGTTHILEINGTTGDQFGVGDKAIIFVFGTPYEHTGLIGPPWILRAWDRINTMNQGSGNLAALIDPFSWLYDFTGSYAVNLDSGESMTVGQLKTTIQSVLSTPTATPVPTPTP